MGLLADIFNPRPAASTLPPWSPSSAPTNQGWFARDISGYVYEQMGGIAVNADTIMRCSTVLAAVRFRANAWAMCPPSTYRRTGNGRVEDPSHYSQRVLRRPNAWQTDFMWRQMNGARMAIWGDSYNEIKPSRTAFVGELWPLHPSRIRIVDQRADGTLLYEYTPPSGMYEYVPPGEKVRQIGQESILHFRDLSMDGLSGLPMYQFMRNVVTIALLAERHSSTFLRKGTRISGLIVPTGALADKDRATLRESLNADLGGANNTGTLGILPHGVDLKPLSQSTKDSQVLEIDDHALAGILRFLGVPGIMVGYSKDLMGYASAKEFYESGGIRHCIQPILENVEAQEEKALLIEGDDRLIKHNLDVLMRANTKDRYEAIFKATGRPWMSPNEARRIEDMNPDPDPTMDKVGVPVNITPGGENMDTADPTPEPTQPRQPPPPADDAPENASLPAPPPVAHPRALVLAERLADDAALSLVAFEKTKVRAFAAAHARDKAAWAAAVLELYGGHVAHVAKKMHISEERARAYCDRQSAALLASGAAAAETFEAQSAPYLASLALEG